MSRVEEKRVLMREIFSENNSRASGVAWFSVELCLPVSTTKWEYILLLSESRLDLPFEVFSCIRTSKDTSWAYNRVELQHRAVNVLYFKWTMLYCFVLYFFLWVLIIYLAVWYNWEGDQHWLTSEPIWDKCFGFCTGILTGRGVILQCFWKEKGCEKLFPIDLWPLTCSFLSYQSRVKSLTDPFKEWSWNSTGLKSSHWFPFTT